jgi:predicted MFS family arabinose efflux permease
VSIAGNKVPIFSAICMLFRALDAWLDHYRGIPRDIWFLALVSLINRIGGMVIVFMTLYLTQELGFSIPQSGYILMFYGVGAFLGAYLGGWLTDRLGYYSVQLWSLVLTGIVLMVIVWVREFWAMCGAVFALSVISETFRPANSVAIQRHSTFETRTRSISLYRMSANLGWAVAPALGGVLIGFGWPYLFWGDGLSCLAAALALVWLLPGKGAVAVAPANPEGLADDTTVERKPIRDPDFLWFLLLTFLGAMVFMQFVWILPVFYKQSFGWSEAMIGLMAAINGLLVFAVEMPLVRQLDGRKRLLVHVQTGILLYAVSYAIFLTPLPPLAAAITYTLAFSIGEIFAMPFSTNYVFARAGSRHAGKYMGLYTMAYSISNIAAPLLGTQVIDRWGFDVLWWVLIGMAAICWGGFRLLDRHTA